MPGITVLCPQQRRALAELDAMIEQIERSRRELCAASAWLTAAGMDAAPVRILLPLTEIYLACLRETRKVLLGEMPQDEAEADALRR